MIYISGKITGNTNYKKDFERGLKAAAYLDKGYVVNPALFEIDNGTWADYMKLDLHVLLECDAIFMLRGWRRSKGARLEHCIAKKLGLEVFYEGGRN